MLSVKINEKQYFLPENWNELTLGKFIEFYKLILNRPNMDNLTYLVQLLSILMECSTSIVEDLYINEINELDSNLQWVNEMPSENNKKIFEIKNDAGEIIKYCFKEHSKIKAKEQLTIEALLKNHDDNTLSFPEVLAVLLRPAIENKNKETGEIEYYPQELDEDMESILNRAEVFKNKLFIGEVYGSVAFFLNGDGKSSMKTSGRSSSLKIEKVKVNS